MLSRLTLPRLDPRASAATLLAPLGDAVLPITGTTTITSITAGGRGQLLLLEFASAACQVTDGSNLKLKNNYISAADGTLLLECDGTNWIEVSRNPLNLESADFPAGLWSTVNPTAVTQSVNVTFTVTTARKFLLGKKVEYICQLTLTSAGTAGSLIVVTTPFSMNANGGQPLGQFRIDRAAGPTHTGIVTVNSAGVINFMVPTLLFLGSNPNFATANGDVLWFSLSGETT